MKQILDGRAGWNFSCEARLFVAALEPVSQAATV